MLLSEEVAGRDEATVRLRRRRAGFPAGKTFQASRRSPLLHPPPDPAGAAHAGVGRPAREPVRLRPLRHRQEPLLRGLGPAGHRRRPHRAWFAIDELGALVRRHRADDTVARAITRITRADLIVVDDIGMLPVGPDAAEGFYRLVDAAYERRSLAVSSNLHPAGFDELMPKTLATATVDRLLPPRHVCVTQGESFRLAQATTGKGVTPLPS
ncbi:MAG TPA: ATP-binding protein [Streptosporangiaceae bacterium]|nr:ATP-binding protein [Streptosporangiaceae bacterium]